MGAPRLRRVSTSKEFDNLIDDYVTQGYSIKNRGERSAMVQKAEYGGLGMHLLLLLCTVGVGNVVYALIKMNGADKIHLKLEEST